jgi:tRNA dimethylallyltransferase
LAKKINTVIISADSRQFYKEMSIGTAKPSFEEQEGIKHYFVDSHSISSPITAADFEKEALLFLEEEFKKHDKIILVGGSGMFIDALCDGLDEIPHDENLRNELSLLVQREGLTKLLKELKKKDEKYYNQVDKNNSNRIIRAIETIRLSGKSYSELRKKKNKNRFFEIKRFVINLPREILYERINIRATKMFENGLIKEVEKLKKFKKLHALNTVGYKETFAYLDNQITLNEAIDKVKQNSRNYAKRQVTWFKRNPSNHWLNGQNLEEQLEEILSLII